MKRSLLGLPVVLAAALAAACTGGDQNSTNNSGGGGAGATGGTATGGGDTGGTGGGNTGGTSTGGSNTGGGNTGGGNTGGSNTGGGNTGGTGGAMAVSCGGIVGDTCDPTQYCDYDIDTCGAGDGAGTCADKPSGCPDVYDPVCACDGMVYGNACEAAAAGVDLSQVGGCLAPDGVFPCGSGFCDAATELCQVDVSDVAGLPDTYTCKPLPPNCPPGGTCACVADLPCANMCEQSGGGVTITCPGG